MGRSREEAQRLADEFMRNANSGNDEANDQLVRDLDDRDPFIVDSD